MILEKEAQIALFFDFFLVINTSFDTTRGEKTVAIVVVVVLPALDFTYV